MIPGWSFECRNLGSNFRTCILLQAEVPLGNFLLMSESGFDEKKKKKKKSLSPHCTGSGSGFENILVCCHVRRPRTCLHGQSTDHVSEKLYDLIRKSRDLIKLLHSNIKYYCLL